MTVGYQGGWCLKYVQDAYGTDHPFPTATAAWNSRQGNHPNEVPPMGITVPVYFSLVGEPAGHVAIRLDDGYVASSSNPGYHPRPFFHPNLDHLMRYYGAYRPVYLGWSEYVGTRKVVGWEDYRDESIGGEVPFDRQTQEDPTLPLGETKIAQSGVTGNNSKTYRIRTIDGREVSRELIGENNTSPVAEITLIGTYVEPVVVPEPEPETPNPTPEDPVVVAPPVKSENNIGAQLIRVLKAIWGRILVAINKYNEEHKKV